MERGRRRNQKWAGLGSVRSSTSRKKKSTKWFAPSPSSAASTDLRSKKLKFSYGKSKKLAKCLIKYFPNVECLEVPGNGFELSGAKDLRGLHLFEIPHEDDFLMIYPENDIPVDFSLFISCFDNVRVLVVPTVYFPSDLINKMPNLNHLSFAITTDSDLQDFEIIDNKIIKYMEISFFLFCTLYTKFPTFENLGELETLKLVYSARYGRANFRIESLCNVIPNLPKLKHFSLFGIHITPENKLGALSQLETFHASLYKLDMTPLGNFLLDFRVLKSVSFNVNWRYSDANDYVIFVKSFSNLNFLEFLTFHCQDFFRSRATMLW